MEKPPILLNLLVLRSPSIDRAVNFYNVLGLQFCKHSHGTGPKHYACELPGMVFEIYPSSAKQPTTTSTRLGFSVRAIDSLISKLHDKGAKIISKPSNSEWGRRAVVEDFDGHTVELTSKHSKLND